MKYGVVIFPTEYCIDPVTLAKEVEARGFESLLFPEHTHIPSLRATPLPSGGELPKEYSHTLDPFVALAAAQSSTHQLKIGTGVALVTERDPIITAKEVATLDYLSGGRFLFGIGGGWNREEMRNHGTEPKTRMRLLEERVSAMKEIWTNENASFTGTFTNFSRIWCWPKPVQKPYPPIILGGNSRQAPDRAARVADEWMPQAPKSVNQVKDLVDLSAKACREMDRDPLPITLYRVPQDPNYLFEIESLGISRAIFSLASSTKTDVLKQLDQIKQTIETLR